MRPDKHNRRPSPASAQRFSTARQAAEAYFAAAGPTAEAEPADVSHAEPTPSVPPAPHGATPAAARAPRVHRLARPATDTAPAGAVRPPDVAQTPADPPAVRRRRRKSPALHGEVTVIRPAAAPDAAPAAVPDAPGRPAETAPQTPDGPGLGATSWPRYPKLLARIRELEAEAERVRQREAAQAIRWIRQTMQAYGIRPEELGLG